MAFLRRDPSLVVDLRVGFGGLVVVGGGDDLDVGTVVEAGCTLCDDLLASGNAAEDLCLAVTGDSRGHGDEVRYAVAADDQDCWLAGCGEDDGCGWNYQRMGSGATGEGDVNGGSGTELTFRVVDAGPDFDGGAAGVECGTDEGDFAIDGVVETRDGDGCGIAGPE